MKKIKGGLLEGDKVFWNVGMGGEILMTGIVIQILENSRALILTKSKNGDPFSMELKVTIDKLNKL